MSVISCSEVLFQAKFEFEHSPARLNNAVEFYHLTKFLMTNSRQEVIWNFSWLLFSASLVLFSFFFNDLYVSFYFVDFSHTVTSLGYSCCVYITETSCRERSYSHGTERATCRNWALTWRRFLNLHLCLRNLSKVSLHNSLIFIWHKTVKLHRILYLLKTMCKSFFFFKDWIASTYWGFVTWLCLLLAALRNCDFSIWQFLVGH